MNKKIAFALGLASTSAIEFDWDKLKIQASDAFKGITIGKWRMQVEEPMMQMEEY